MIFQRISLQLSYSVAMLLHIFWNGYECCGDKIRGKCCFRSCQAPDHDYPFYDWKITDCRMHEKDLWFLKECQRKLLKSSKKFLNATNVAIVANMITDVTGVNKYSSATPTYFRKFAPVNKATIIFIAKSRQLAIVIYIILTFTRVYHFPILGSTNYFGIAGVYVTAFSLSRRVFARFR